MKRPVVNLFSSAVALAVGLLTIWVSVRYVKPPADSIDWLVLILSGLTTATIAFFMTWGHFQSDPAPAKQNP